MVPVNKAPLLFKAEFNYSAVIEQDTLSLPADIRSLLRARPGDMINIRIFTLSDRKHPLLKGRHELLPGWRIVHKNLQKKIIPDQRIKVVLNCR